MQLHNTLSKRLDEFKPLKDGQVGIYSCGPTVYDHIHIGNLMSFTTADILRRTLQASGYQPKHIMNFTDVDDKIIRLSQQATTDATPEDAMRDLTRKYETIFLEDMRNIGNDVDALTFVRATDSIASMQKLITELHKAGIAYIADDGVYFSISAYKRDRKVYGQLLKLDTKNTSEARISNDEYDKDSIHDFALWKTRKDNEPAWDFELDGHNLLGRPGWHIECSAMSTAALGQPFDIHTGGIDLVFPHHENEIAQSTAGHDDPRYANYFVHNEHLLVEGRKMSKSLSNFFTLRDIEEKGYEPLAFRMLVLQGHYRNQLNFSWEGLEAAKNRLRRWRNLSSLRFQTIDHGDDVSKKLTKQAEVALKALQADIDTPNALVAYEAGFAAIENGLTTTSLKAFEDFLKQIDDLLGFDLAQQTDLTAEQKQLLTKRQAARDNKDWATADQLRNQLSEQSIEVRDTANRQIWSRS